MAIAARQRLNRCMDSGKLVTMYVAKRIIASRNMTLKGHAHD